MYTLGVAAEAINPCIVSAEDFMEEPYLLTLQVSAGLYSFTSRKSKNYCIGVKASNF
jgi:hypothetical protein